MKISIGNRKPVRDIVFRSCGLNENIQRSVLIVANIAPIIYAIPVNFIIDQEIVGTVICRNRPKTVALYGGELTGLKMQGILVCAVKPVSLRIDIRLRINRYGNRISSEAK